MTAIREERSRATGSARPEPNQSWRRTYSRWLTFSDCGSIIVAVGLAQKLRFGTWSETAYSQVSIVIASVWMAMLAMHHSRSQQMIGSGAEEYRRVWLGTISAFGGVAIISMLLKLEIARGYLMIALPTGLLLLVLFRWIARRLLVRARMEHGRCVTRVLVVGNASAVRDLATALTREPWSGYQVVGAWIPGSANLDPIEVRGIGSLPTYGSESSIVDVAMANNSHAIAVAATEQIDGRRIRDLSWELEGFNIDLLLAPGVLDVAGPRLHMRPVAGLPLIQVEKPRYHGAKQLQKRFFDVTFSGLVLLCGLPLLVAIAIAIRMTSKGTIFYRQERVGLDGVAFEMIKFRTMVDGADARLNDIVNLNESIGGVLFKIREDPRITSVGRVLRKYSLDEIPQFINVLKGDMSVVGPRPPLASEVKMYDENAKRRLLVHPGITGLWQISGRSDLSWEDSVRLDLYYVENWSMVADILIALKTAKAVLCHRGAY